MEKSLRWAINSAWDGCSNHRLPLAGPVVALAAIIVFAEEDDSYHYASWFDSEGEHAKSVGVQIQRGYPHVALLYEGELHSTETIVHELTHQCLSHLPIPLWLDEGVAQHLQKTIVGARVVLDDLTERHFGYWNQERIQRFWAGASFHETRDSVELSYNLAVILVHFLIQKDGDFLTFLRSARADDAGQTAAWDCYECCLGEAVGTFLGPGDWRPQRKAIKACWRAAGWGGENSVDT